MARINIYTDGACSGNPGPGGWGVVILKDEEVLKHSGSHIDTTNNRMELLAVCKALEYLNSIERQKANIYSDSAYVVNAINECWIKKWKERGWKTSKDENVKNKDLWERIDKMLKILKDVRIIKVKGHNGDTFNEEADRLAKLQVELIKTATT
jgi:ribonuclease HI